MSKSKFLTARWLLLYTYIFLAGFAVGYCLVIFNIVKE